MEIPSKILGLFKERKVHPAQNDYSDKDRFVLGAPLKEIGKKNCTLKLFFDRDPKLHSLILVPTPMTYIIAKTTKQE